MKINSLNLIFVWGFILFFILPPKISAETLTTVSGKVYNNYKFIDFYADQALVSHAEGVTFLKYTDLPKDIREQYSKEIRGHNLQSPLKKFARLQLTTASQNANPLRAIRQLTKIKNQYSSYPGIVAAFDQAIRKKQNEISIGKILDKSADLKTPSQQYTQLQQMLSNVTDPGLSKEINFFLEKENNFLKQISEVLDAAISDAAALEEPTMFFQRFADIKQVITTYLTKEPLVSYLKKVNKHVSEKQNELKDEINKNNEQIALLLQKNPDAQIQLNKEFLYEENINRQLAEKIISETMSLEEAIVFAQTRSNHEKALLTLKKRLENSLYALNRNKAKRIITETESLEEAIAHAKTEQDKKNALLTLKTSLENLPYALNKIQAKIAIKHLEKVVQQQQEFEDQIAQLRKIRMLRHDKGPFVIRKKINTNNDWKLIVVPYSSKKIIIEIWNLNQEYNEALTLSNQHKKMADDCRKKNNQKVAESYEASSIKHNDVAQKAKTKRDHMVKSIQNKIVSFDILAGRCSLDGLPERVILVATERYLSESEFKENMWYKEYNSEEKNNQWDIE